ncbi:MAG: phosphoadenosine phosphosulfate reductase family protein [Clostridiales bacterium]|nr:phosphoadenosine phosphosulfate reductase family protein [Clostridiales bacterium]
MSKIYWCHHCNIPIYTGICGLCGQEGSYLTTDLRPVFPEERLLVEITLGKPFAFKNDSVWNGTGNTYFVNGKKIKFVISNLKNIDDNEIRIEYQELSKENSYATFDETIARFIKANEVRFNEITTEAKSYIKNIASGLDLSDMFVSFSGGKDSTVVSDLVIKALGNPKILHIFGDTTLEFPETMEYVKNFKASHRETPVLSSRNKDKNFNDLCQIVGPPSRVMRWCCTVFKTGSITRKIESLFKNKKNIITFYGIRRSESTSRSKYERESDSPKITKQKVIAPIIDWFDFDVWLYILSEKVDFNSAYRLGYARVGCWCCPNNSIWSEYLSKVHMPEQFFNFRSILVDFARNIGKPDAEEYVDSGNWKARQGGNGLDIANKSIISFTPCATEENSFNYELQKPISEELYELFKPFGYLNYELGNKRLGEVYVLSKSGTVKLKLQGRIGTSTLKVTIIDHRIARATSMKTAEEKIKCQLTKYQMCMSCMACPSICKHDAITIRENEEKQVIYKINTEKCVRCGECVGHFNGGCYMRKVLAVKRG